MLTPRPQRPTALTLVMAVTPPPHVPLPARTPKPAYDPHSEPTTQRMHRPTVAPRLGPGEGDCSVCWCSEEAHRAGYNDRLGACKRPGCDTACGQYKRHRTWRTFLRWVGFAAGFLVAALCTPAAIFLVAAIWEAIP